jgi:hypothetical protein
VKAAARLVVMVFLAFSCIAGLKCCTSKMVEAKPNSVAMVNRQDGGSTYLVIEQRKPPAPVGKERKDG